MLFGRGTCRGSRTGTHVGYGGVVSFATSIRSSTGRKLKRDSYLTNRYFRTIAITVFVLICFRPSCFSTPQVGYRLLFRSGWYLFFHRIDVFREVLHTSFSSMDWTNEVAVTTPWTEVSVLTSARSTLSPLSGHTTAWYKRIVTDLENADSICYIYL